MEAKAQTRYLRVTAQKARRVVNLVRGQNALEAATALKFQPQAVATDVRKLIESAVANALLDWLGQPLISTSANLSGSPTCRSGIEVFGMMDGRVDLVLDSGPGCGGGPGTTIDITEPYWRIVKEGSIAERDIAACLGGV